MSRCVYRFERTSRNVSMSAAGGPSRGRGGFAVTKLIAGAGRLQTSRSAFGALVLISVGLAGCESSSGLLGASSATPETQIAQPASLASGKVAAASTRVSVAPVIGAPDGVAKQIAQDFSSAIAQKNVTVVAAQDNAEYALRGYVVAAKEKSAVKVSYIWDVTDPSGRRVNRITGEELVAGAAGADPWAGVTPQITQAIAQKSAVSLAAWIAQQTQARSAVASSGGTAVSPTSVGAIPPTTTPAVAQQPRMAAAAPPASASTQVAAVIPSLVGAPGDGNNALASALQAELNKNGIGNANQGGTPYRVEGVVKIGAAADGKQPVQIDWNVKDPQGKRLGTVTQKNEIAAGSLDATWGRTADAAAAAAAQGILKLLPKATASN